MPIIRTEPDDPRARGHELRTLLDQLAHNPRAELSEQDLAALPVSTHPEIRRAAAKMRAAHERGSHREAWDAGDAALNKIADNWPEQYPIATAALTDPDEPEPEGEPDLDALAADMFGQQ